MPPLAEVFDECLQDTVGFTILGKLNDSSHRKHEFEDVTLRLHSRTGFILVPTAEFNYKFDISKYFNDKKKWKRILHSSAMECNCLPQDLVFIASHRNADQEDVVKPVFAHWRVIYKVYYLHCKEQAKANGDNNFRLAPDNFRSKMRSVWFKSWLDATIKYHLPFTEVPVDSPYYCDPALLNTRRQEGRKKRRARIAKQLAKTMNVAVDIAAAAAQVAVASDTVAAVCDKPKQQFKVETGGKIGQLVQAMNRLSDAITDSNAMAEKYYPAVETVSNGVQELLKMLARIDLTKNSFSRMYQ